MLLTFLLIFVLWHGSFMEKHITKLFFCLDFQLLLVNKLRFVSSSIGSFHPTPQCSTNVKALLSYSNQMELLSRYVIFFDMNQEKIEHL